MNAPALKKAKRTKKLSPYRELWQAAGGLLSNAEDPKFVKTATAMCGKKDLENLYRVWAKGLRRRA